MAAPTSPVTTKTGSLNGHEDHERELEDALAAVAVTEPAVDRQSGRGGEQIRRDRSGHPADTVQFADDLGERGGDDHLLQRGEEQGEHEGGEDQPDAARTELGRSVRRWRCRGGAGSSFTSVIAPMRTALLAALTDNSRVKRQLSASAASYGMPGSVMAIHSNR